MFGRSHSRPVAEHEADGEIERVYHEIRQLMRISGVNLNFRSWATFPAFFPAMWDAMRPNVQTLAFEQAADRIREQAASLAMSLAPEVWIARGRLGLSQSFHVRESLDLYHYINPKLLVFTAAVKLALAGHEIGRPPSETNVILPRGIPPKMIAFEMEDDQPDNEHLRQLFDDIRTTLDLPSVNSDYRTMALWPDYLAAAWDRLKPLVQKAEYDTAASDLRQLAREKAAALPYPVKLDRPTVEALGEDYQAIVALTDRFENLLPGLIINIAVLQSEWKSGEELAASPFPAATQTVEAVS